MSTDPTSPDPGTAPTSPIGHGDTTAPLPRTIHAPGLLPPRIGRYAPVSVLGQGGMGTVYLAEQDNPKRMVALKVIRAGYLSPELMRRFGQESQVLARLQHPGIAQVYEAGTADDGQGHALPFFAMEFIKGVPLTDYATRQSLGTRDRLELVAKICDAVYHAHQKGVIHRDLKPGNILVDDTGQPKVLDFGIARATDSDIQQSTLQTDIGQLIGTVPYMSPEQVSGDPADLDTRSDVYALGVIAYEILAGRLPYDLQKKMIHEAARIIKEEEPTRLSSINRTLRGDVETIVAKALEKEKTRRYQSAEALASDIRRYLKDEPITARPASTWYQVSKFSRRNKGLVGGVVAAFAVLLIGVIATGASLQRALAAETGLTAQLKETEKARAAEAVERVRADERAFAAQTAEKAEKERADQLKKVSDFQSQMLAQIDTKSAGEGLMADVRDRFAAALEKAGMPEADRGAQTKTLSDLLIRVNATDTAAAMIDRTILRPAIETIDKQFKDDPATDASLRQALATLYYDRLALYDQASPLQESALSTRRRVLGEEHPDTLSSINNMGFLLQAQGKLDQAEPYHREALEKSRRVLGEEHPETLIFINNMGLLLQAQGRLDQAERYYREALEKCRRVQGEEHPQTLTSINNMGFLLQAQGKLAEAEPYHREALEKYRRVLGEEHRETLGSINNMGFLLQAQGRLAEAETYYREALEKRRRVLGEEHPETLVSVSYMGLLLEAQGKLAEAEPYVREAMEKRRRVLGEEHPDTLIAINNMGSLLWNQGKFAEAEPFYREALEKFRRVLGEEHPNTLTSISNIGLLLRDQRKLAEAEPFYREALEKSRRVLGEEHPDTLGSINNMGSLLLAQGRLDQAEPYYREALAKFRRVLGEEHPNTLFVLSNVGALLRAQYKHQEAIDLLAPAEPRARAAFTGGNARRLANFLAALGRARVGLGYDAERFALAESNLLDAHAIYLAAKGFGSKHKDTLECVRGLVDLYTAWDAAVPGKGYDAKAAEWKAKLPAEAAPKP